MMFSRGLSNGLSTGLSTPFQHISRWLRRPLPAFGLLGIFGLVLIGLVLIQGCANQEPAAEAKTNAAPIIYVLGDLHGDLNAAKTAMALTGATNTNGEWVGEGLTVVQTGDLIDRGPQDRAVLDWFRGLETEAKAHQSTLHLLNGNHEVMNVDGDFRYIHPDSMAEFADLVDSERSQQLGITDAPKAIQGRANAFAPGGLYAQQLAERPVVLTLDGTVFVHGGILPTHADYGLTQINQDYADHLGEGKALPSLLHNKDGPLWTRAYSLPGAEADCKRLNQALEILKADRMVVAHSVQPHINSACDGKVWRIDTGMSVAYQGRVEVLKLQGETATILTPDSP